MRYAFSFLVLWIVCNGCANNDPVNRPYMISQSPMEEPSEISEVEEADFN